MRRNALLLGLALSLAHVGAQAALPPTYQRLAELKAVLDDSNVLRSLPEGSLIERVEYIKPDHYEITAGQCTLAITLKDKPLPMGMVGARQFEIVPGTTTCNLSSRTP